jgi:protein-tyrosine phosphatase
MPPDPHELRVDFLAAGDHGRPGRLGITAAPGRWRPGRDASANLVRMDVGFLREAHQVDVVVTLMEEFEMERFAVGGLRGALRRAGIASYWFPIPDVSVPSSLPATSRLVTRILRSLARAETLIVHCLGGLGRSGTIAACCLVATGKGPATAIDSVRRARPGAVEVPDQELFVKRFAAHIGHARD